MLKSYTVCDCCGKKLEATGIKFVQPVALTPLPVNGNSSKRIDVKGVDFCSVACVQSAMSEAFVNLTPVPKIK